VPCTGAVTTGPHWGPSPAGSIPDHAWARWACPLGPPPVGRSAGTGRAPQPGSPTLVAPSLRAPGPLARPRKSVGIAQGEWPPPKAIQAISGQAHGRRCTRYRRLLARGTHATQGIVAMARACVGLLWASAHQGPRTASSDKIEPDGTHTTARCQHAWAEAPPRCGGTRDRVTRLSGMLVPRVRQAPDGRTAGGRPPTASSKSHRRHAGLPLFQGAKV
jgi:hypothetical protein